MSGNNIIRLNLDRSNVSSTPKPLEFNIINTIPFVNNSSDYEVFVEKAEIPISENLPLFVSDGPIMLTFELTDKDDKDPIFDSSENLFYHVNLAREYRSMKELVDAINTALSLLSVDYRWCTLSVDNEDRLIFTVTNYLVAPKTKIWVEGAFFSAFQGMSGVRNDGHFIQQHEYFELYNPTEINKPYTQSVSYFYELVNLKSFRIFTTLPTESFWLFDHNNQTMVPSNLLTEVVYNSKQMVGNNNLIFLPQINRKSSCTDGRDISKFRLWVSAYYYSGREIILQMDRGTYFSTTLVFERKVKI